MLDQHDFLSSAVISFKSWEKLATKSPFSINLMLLFLRKAANNLRNYQNNFEMMFEHKFHPDFFIPTSRLSYFNGFSNENPCTKYQSTSIKKSQPTLIAPKYVKKSWIVRVVLEQTITLWTHADFVRFCGHDFILLPKLQKSIDSHHFSTAQ